MGFGSLILYATRPPPNQASADAAAPAQRGSAGGTGGTRQPADHRRPAFRVHRDLNLRTAPASRPPA
jgi:hypothetical protein